MLQRDALVQRGIDFRGEETEVVAPLRLRAIHRRVRVLEQGLGVVAVLRVQAHAQAGAGVEFPSGHEKRLGRRLQHALYDMVHAFSAALVHQHQDELVAAQARDRVAFTHADLEPLRHHLQQLVARAVPQAVVEILEVVQVEERNRELVPLALGVRDRLMQAVVQEVAVGQSGKRIVAGLVLQPLAIGLDLRDVADESFQRHWLAAVGIEHQAFLGHPFLSSTALDQAVLDGKTHARSRAAADLLAHPLAVVRMRDVFVRHQPVELKLFRCVSGQLEAAFAHELHGPFFVVATAIGHAGQVAQQRLHLALRFQ